MGPWLHGVVEDIQRFVETGGEVLIAIGAVTLLMWTLIAERWLYLWLAHPGEERAELDQWNSRQDRTSWCARKVREMHLSRMSLRLRRGLLTIKTLIALCPLLGLLGTVAGMIEVFDVMAAVGSGNTRAMASGVSMATIPTMSGMVAALSGIYFAARLERTAKKREERFDKGLPLQARAEHA